LFRHLHLIVAAIGPEADVSGTFVLERENHVTTVLCIFSR